MFRIGWSAVPQSAEPGDPWPAGEYRIKTISVPRGSWVIQLPVRVRWGGPGEPGQHSGISVMWHDPFDELLFVADKKTGMRVPDDTAKRLTPDPVAFAFSDHMNIEAGQPGDADVAYPLSCGIVVVQQTALTAVLTTTGVNVAHVVDGDGLRWASAPW